MSKEEAYLFLYHMAEGISEMFGNYCETVIHEVKGEELWTVAIFHGHVSGRTGPTLQGIFGTPIQKDSFNFEKMLEDHVNQMVVHPSGKLVKSSTFFLKGEGYTYALGINYDITLMEQIKNMTTNFTTVHGDLFTSLQGKGDITMENVFENALKVVNKPIARMKKDDRLTLVQILKERNFFEFQKSVPYLSGRLNVSKYTIYKYINEISEG